jgi:hypothetical protein
MAVPADPPAGVALRGLEGPHKPGRRVYSAIRAGAEAYPSLAPVLAALQAAARCQPQAPASASGTEGEGELERVD